MEHEVVVCSNCPEKYCVECDYPPGLREVAALKPGLCPICLENTEYFWEHMKNGG